MSGLEITASSGGYYSSHARYASKLLTRVGITNNKTFDTPFETNVKLCDTSSDLFPNTLYC